MNDDVIMIGAGPGCIFAAYELMQKNPELRAAVSMQPGISLPNHNPKETER